MLWRARLDKPLKRLQTAVKHLSEVDEFFDKEDPQYHVYRKKWEALGKSYDSFSQSMYAGDYGRQMQLVDVLTYMIVSRSSIWAAKKQNLSDYMRMMFYTINQLLIQEHVTGFPALRKKFMKHLEDAHLDNYIESKKYEKNYKKAKASSSWLTYQKDGDVYWAVDHLLPKSLGAAVELTVYLYLIRNKIGYVVPLLLEQRLLGLDDHLVAPDFLVVKYGSIYGVEVEQLAKTGKTHQSNPFVAETDIPVITASTLRTFPLRCPECRRWILFCDNIIDKFCNLKYRITSQKITCSKCNEVVYYGRLEKGGQALHYHLKCVEKYPYVTALLKKKEQRKRHLVAYFPYARGLEKLAKRWNAMDKLASKP